MKAKHTEPPYSSNVFPGNTDISLYSGVCDESLGTKSVWVAAEQEDKQTKQAAARARRKRSSPGSENASPTRSLRHFSPGPDTDCRTFQTPPRSSQALSRRECQATPSLSSAYIYITRHKTYYMAAQLRNLRNIATSLQPSSTQSI